MLPGMLGRTRQKPCPQGFDNPAEMTWVCGRGVRIWAKTARYKSITQMLNKGKLRECSSLAYIKGARAVDHQGVLVTEIEVDAGALFG